MMCLRLPCLVFSMSELGSVLHFSLTVALGTFLLLKICIPLPHTRPGEGGFGLLNIKHDEKPPRRVFGR